MAGHRRAAHVRRDRRRVRDLQHCARAAPDRHPRCAVRGPARATTRASVRSREIVGVDPALAARWSDRRASIEERRAELASSFQATHGRPPSPVESVQLAQQATLETRQGKHGPRSLAEQRATWADQALQVLGSESDAQAMLHQALHPPVTPTHRVDAAWVRETAATIQETLQEHRSYWQRWHVRPKPNAVSAASTFPPATSTASSASWSTRS
ncbi:relaxase domain-containing protein [Cellulomonas sp. P24]|uniref:relaxase domain-containing protein n=1 Tax=Cellulomonas sp. P24 TaxID=2885206 RepID=UPI0037C08322